jgi:hypothetical protein
MLKMFFAPLVMMTIELAKKDGSIDTVPFSAPLFSVYRAGVVGLVMGDIINFWN